MKRNFRKPLVVVGPKTMLRSTEAVSSLSEMASPSSFQPVLTDPSVDSNSYVIPLFLGNKQYLYLTSTFLPMKG